MTTQFKVGDKVVHSGLKATIIVIIHTKEQFKSMGINYHLFEELGFTEITFEESAKDATQFPMNIIIYNEKSVVNIERMNELIDVKNLIDEFNVWLETTTIRNSIEFTPERKQAFPPQLHLRHFIDERNKNNDRIIIPSFDDIVPITPNEEEKLDVALDNELKLALSGGRSRKRRHPSRIKKTCSRSRSRSRSRK